MLSIHCFGGGKKDEKALADLCHGLSMHLNENGGMIMTIKRGKFAPALTLTEVVIATVVLVITASGALSHQYHATRDALIARAHMAATRTAQLLLEDWMSTGGSNAYDPSTLGLGFSPAISIPPHFTQDDGGGLGTPLNNAIHAVTVDEIPMLVMLTSSDIAVDTQARVALRQLGVIVEFADQAQIAQQLANIESVVLTTYVRVSASSG
jgi:type II secretory pathway pseudopilin PulG